MGWEQDISKMDKAADKVIARWSMGALVANLLPPPLDTMAVATVFARLGAAIGEVYEVKLNWNALVSISKSIAAGIAAVATAGYIGTSLFKYIPGLNIWVALLVQPPIIGAITYSVGNVFKDYYRFHITKGRDLSTEELKEIAESYFRGRINQIS